MSARRKIEVVDTVSIEVPREMAGVVAGALSFAMDVATGWPASLERHPDAGRHKDAVYEVIDALRKAQRESEKKP